MSNTTGARWGAHAAAAKRRVSETRRRTLLHSHSRNVRATLMQNQLIHLAARVLHETHLRIHDLEKELSLRLREERKFRLIRCLKEKCRAFPCNGNLESGR